MSMGKVRDRRFVSGAKSKDAEYRPREIISGGQTGVDRAALDASLALGIPCGGWCPRGRRAEDGVIPQRYPLRESDTGAYPQRTALNVAGSDGTLIFARGELSGGTALTAALVRKSGKPCQVVDLVDPQAQDITAVLEWLSGNDIAVLNVAGPRESQQPGIYRESREFIEDLFS